MARPVSRVTEHSIIAAISLLLTFANVGLVYGIDAFGSPFLFAGAIVAEICLLLVFLYSVVRALDGPLHILLSILISAWEGVLTNTYVKRLQKTNSRFLLWLGRRLNPHRPTGLLLSVGVVISLYFFANFISILIVVLSHRSLTQIDSRVVNLMPSIRTDDQTKFFRFVTCLANPEPIVLLIILMVGMFWCSRKWMMGWTVIIVAALTESCALVLKYLVARPRPDRALALVSEHDFSFPSGHVLSATVLFGLLAYLLYRSFKRPLVRLVVALGYVISVGLVAVSRIYLGAHYPTDVLGSLYFGAGILTATITGIEVAVRTHLLGMTRASIENRRLVLAVPIIVVLSLLAAPYFVHIDKVTPNPHYKVLPSISQQTIQQLPLHTETLTGKAAEPISFIYVGSEDQIKQLFLTHAWYEADQSTIANTLQAVSVGFQGHQYFTAPVTPAYLAMQPEAIAFEQPTQRNTLRQRHHTRLWRTGLKLRNGQEVWVATASFDEGVELAGTFKLPTHRIAPDIDAERSYIIQSLGITNTYYVSVVHAQAGENASGDVFFTDGRAAVITL